MSAGSPPDCETRKVNTEEDFLLMVAYLTGTLPAKKVHFVVTDKARREMKNWDYDARQAAHWVLTQPVSVEGFGQKDIGVHE